MAALFQQRVCKSLYFPGVTCSHKPDYYMKPLSIVAFFDGRPGHEKQTRGILNALAVMTPTKVESILVTTVPSTYAKNCAAYFFPFLLQGQSESKWLPADLIIGTGSHTHFPMLLSKKLRHNQSGQQIRVVTCMTPEVFLRNKFDLCCIPMHDEPAPADNVFVTLGPPNTVEHKGIQQDDRGLILVGGVDLKSHVWKSEGTVAQIRIIVDRNPEMYWTVSSSPRTPENTCQDLEVMAVSIKNVSFFRSTETPAGWIEEQYSLNRKVWVTADSISMVYEALSAGCAVGVLPVEWRHQDNKFNKSLEFLTEKKMIIDFESWRKGTPMPAQRPESLNESKRCAREILLRWWPDRLE
jgi:mitochondrial fission protein ELM1